MFEVSDRIRRPGRPAPGPVVPPTAAVLAAVRRWLASHRRVRWLIAAGAAGLAVGGQVTAFDAARRAESAWGSSVEVWVAVADHAPGDPLRVEVRRVPEPIVPAGAVGFDPSARSARQYLGDGEIVATFDVVVTPGPASTAPPGSVVVPVADPLAPLAPIGTPVVVATDGVVLSADALVVGVADGVTLVAVRPSEGAVVAAAARQGAIGLLFPSVTVDP